MRDEEIVDDLGLETFMKIPKTGFLIEKEVTYE